MAQPAPIEQFGKYQILERVARGGMAEIFKARMEGIGGFNRLFAIKRIVPGLSQNREYIDLLVDEAKIAGLLSHANIVQILDLGQVDGQYYVAMEYVEGRDLGTVIERCNERGITLPVPHAVFVLIEVLKGLEYAHNRQIMRGNRPMPLNIVHRDVSPSNVLVSFQGEVKLTDFGIAKANVKAMETLSGVIKGKFDYMSPEQAKGEDIDQRTDLFAAGVLLYEMLCGEHPFRQPSEIKTIAAIRKCEYQPPSFVNPDVPYGLEVILDQALAQDPTQRFTSATAFKEALTKFFHDAGFIFSHSTLAAFLKGLFPEATRGRRRPPQKAGQVVALREQETRPLPLEDIDDEDRPTTLDDEPPPPPATDTQPHRAPRRPRRVPPAPDPTDEPPAIMPTPLPERPAPSGVYMPGEGPEPPRNLLESETLLRRIPAERVTRTTNLKPPEAAPAPASPQPPAPTAQPTGEEATLIRGPDSDIARQLREAQERIDEWGDEVETVVQADPLIGEVELGPEHAVEVTYEDDGIEELSLDEATRTQKAPKVPKPPKVDKAPKVTRPPKVDKAPKPAKAGPSRLKIAMFAGFVGVLGAGGGLLLGLGVGLAVAWFAPIGAGDPAMMVGGDPVLIVDAPEGAEVRIDGVKARGKLPTERVFPAGSEVEVEVTVDGAEPVTRTVPLSAGERAHVVVVAPSESE
ncbi:MAG: protein kinase [Alphaproteobacteria bacterium]|nr:protein kinase [Alphaproteobacteria bacterium]